MCLGLVPELFDAVEFEAVGRQEVQGQALFLEQVNVGTDAFCGVDRGVVEDDGQWLGYVLLEQSEEAHEEVRGRCLPELGAEQAIAGEQ